MQQEINTQAAILGDIKIKSSEKSKVEDINQILAPYIQLSDAINLSDRVLDEPT